MTSRRVFLTLFATLLTSCASLPDDAPVVEQLDDETGLTIARLGKPLESYCSFFTTDFMKSLFPGATIREPVCREWQHCCILRN